MRKEREVQGITPSPSPRGLINKGFNHQGRADGGGLLVASLLFAKGTVSMYSERS